VTLHPEWPAQAFGRSLEITCRQLLPDSAAGDSLTAALNGSNCLHGKIHFHAKLLQHLYVAFTAPSEAEIFANHNAFRTHVRM
jgi:hypothetical protein